MNSGKTIFAQLMNFVPAYEFRKCVRSYNGNYKVQSSSAKLYHLGIRSQVSRNTLAHANQVRDWRIYADFAQVLIGTARHLYRDEDFGVELNQTVYALDATTIDLCLSLFPWAQFRRHKAAVKLHTLLDLRGSIPTVVIITAGKTHDVNVLDQL